MSITFGIFLLSFTASTAAWATVGERIAKIPTVARALDYVNGGYAIPSDAQVVLSERQRNFIRAHTQRGLK